MSFLRDHDKEQCKRCGKTGRCILSKIRALVDEYEKLVEEEKSIEEEEDVRCIISKSDFVPPLITFPENEERVKYKLNYEKTTPVWELKRYPSKELIGGIVRTCVCSKSNGLSGDCSRWHCRGRAGCLAFPPTCPGSRLWTKPITNKQICQILDTYNPKKLQACNNHSLFDPNCESCKFYIKNIDNMQSRMSSLDLDNNVLH